MKLLSLNSSSKYIPNMLSKWEDIFSKIPENKFFNCNIVLNVLTFGIFTSIVFGEDIYELTKNPDLTYDYINDKNEIVKLTFREFFIECIQCYIIQYYNIMGTVLPFTNTYNLIQPFKRNSQNVKTLYKILGELWEKSLDPSSILKKWEKVVIRKI